VALDHLDEDARDLDVTVDDREFVRSELANELERKEHPSDQAYERAQSKRRLKLRALSRRRRELLRLRDEQRIDDSVMLDAQQALDYEELHLGDDESAK
jgi:CPA1 family monovalent cation:H+ antiporter